MKTTAALNDYRNKITLPGTSPNLIDNVDIAPFVAEWWTDSAWHPTAHWPIELYPASRAWVRNWSANL